MFDLRSAAPVVTLLIDADTTSAADTIARIAAAVGESVDIHRSPDPATAIEDCRSRRPLLVLIDGASVHPGDAALLADLRSRTGAQLVVLDGALSEFRAEALELDGVLRLAAGDVWSLRSLMALAGERQRVIEAAARSQRMEALGRLAGGVFHDFGNLLQIIQGHAEVLAEKDSVTPAEHSEALGAIADASERGSELVRQLLALGAAPAATASVVVVDNLIVGMRPMLVGLAGVSCRVQIAPGAAGASVRIDPSALEQSILNLVLNARHAVQASGSIVVQTRWERDGTEQGTIVLEVIDDGCGMAPATVERALDPFFSTRSARDGSGLGLSSVNEVVRQCGGAIEIVSEMGQGTRICLRLPAIAAASAPVLGIGVHSDHAPSASQAPMILFVDDEPLVVNVVRNILKRAGYRCVTASCAEEAERLFMQHREDIDLLVTDVMMPDVNGRELFERLRRVEPDLAVVFMSGFANDPDLAGVMNSSLRRRLVEKPFRADRLLEVIGQVLMTPVVANEA